ncbi:hypothetical protein CERSUDRAFT_55392 [Gelatoporia subvermispora B]|uniref:Uncharacterized protein n=1 Tax=Ceriporiopsis subvermispora (strain B) TaxID=914234 RepID=M2PF47_CERS8|nr:hypothetical protein CERSUDRAFT_55392 [Gelatoporia subvermispora B]
MKKLAARDFEDMLQCIIPVFEGLLPEEDNKIVMDLLYELVTWHVYAKLRLHTESTLDDLEQSTVRLGAALRRFKKTTCERYATFELPKEEAARGRRKARQAAAGKPKQKGRRDKGKDKQTSSETSPRKRKEFNMCTAKLHALGHYIDAIRKYGTTDNYTTQIVRAGHPAVSVRRANKICRASWSTDESNGSMQTRTRTSLRSRLHLNNDGKP